MTTAFRRLLLFCLAAAREDVAKYERWGDTAKRDYWAAEVEQIEALLA